MLHQADFSPDVVNNLLNQSLESAIRALLYSRDERNFQNFSRTFFESNLVVLMETKIVIPENHVLNFDEDGYGYYPKNSKIPLVQLMNNDGHYILPAFSNAQQVHNMEGLESFFGLAVTGKSCLEMFRSAGSTFLILNPGAKEQFFIDKEFVAEMHSCYALPCESPEFLPTE